MFSKKVARLKRAKRARLKIRELGAIRLSIHRTPKHIYAQVISVGEGRVVASASTVEKSAIGESLKQTGNAEAAVVIGKLIAERAVKAGVTTVAFDRSGFKYHGRVKALADAARENGLKF